MTAEVLDYRIKQINHITGIDILDDKSLDEALFKLIGMYSNLKKENMEIKAKAIDEFADKLSKYLNVESATKYGNKDAEQQRNSYDTLMKYEIADAIDDIAEQMKAGGENEND